MRVVSQRGDMDFPYEMIAMYMSEDNESGETLVVCRWQPDQGAANILARYSCEENAIMSMMECRANFGKHLGKEPYRFPSDRYFQTLKKSMLEASNGSKGEE